MKYLLDTCTVSEVARKIPDQAVKTWFNATPADVMALSTVTVGEIAKGAALVDDVARRSALESWLDHLRLRFARRILPIDAEVAIVWGHLTAALQRAGRSLPVLDSLIAATAHHHGLVIVTRNVTHFEPTQVKVLNPWSTLR